jgi:hypothetical protein
MNNASLGCKVDGIVRSFRSAADFNDFAEQRAAGHKQTCQEWKQARDPFANLRVAITGGTSGLGLALVRELLGRGAQVAFVARGRERVQLSPFPKSLSL